MICFQFTLSTFFIFYHQLSPLVAHKMGGGNDAFYNVKQSGNRPYVFSTTKIGTCPEYLDDGLLTLICVCLYIYIK